MAVNIVVDFQPLRLILNDNTAVLRTYSAILNKNVLDYCKNDVSKAKNSRLWSELLH
jgi:hypothetical protein